MPKKDPEPEKKIDIIHVHFIHFVWKPNHDLFTIA